MYIPNRRNIFYLKNFWWFIWIIFFFLKPHTTNDRKQLPMKCVCNSKIPARYTHTRPICILLHIISYTICVFFSHICVCYNIIYKCQAEHIGHNLLLHTNIYSNIVHMAVMSVIWMNETLIEFWCDVIS